MTTSSRSTLAPALREGTLTKLRTFAGRMALAAVMLTPGASLRLAGAEPSAPSAPAPNPEPRQATPEETFPYVIKVSTEPAGEGFHRGDHIKVVTVRGTRKHIEVGGSYLVQGTYTLASVSEATLSLSLTNSTRVRSAWQPPQVNRIEKGSGAFSFTATMTAPGKFHVSFYFSPGPGKQNTSQGGIYFEG